MMNVFEYQCHLGGLGYYKLKRKDGTLAIDGIPGQATKQAIYNFQIEHRKRPDGSLLDTDGFWGPATEKAMREVIGSNEPPQTASAPAEKPKEPGTYKWVSVNDFKCRCGGRYCNGWPAQPSKKTLDLLEQIGEHFQKRIIPHSGLRCQQWNANEGGAPTSKHMYGMAMDFHIDGVTPKQLYDYCDSLLGNSGGLGLYSWGVHIDDRHIRGRW